jgi:N-acetylmuramoyl-L-alanine amidase
LHKTESQLQVSKRENSVIKLEKDYESNKTYGEFDPNSNEAYIIFSLIQNAYMTHSQRFAAHVENEFKKHTKLKSRGVKQAGFLVLWKSTMPGVLIETGFLSNENDRKVLAKDSSQTTMARSIFYAVKKYKAGSAKK